VGGRNENKKKHKGVLKEKIQKGGKVGFINSYSQKGKKSGKRNENLPAEKGEQGSSWTPTPIGDWNLRGTRKPVIHKLHQLAANL